MDKHEMAFQLYCSLIANSARYEYISELVDSGKLSQQEATDKNINKAYKLAEQFIENTDHR